MMTRFAGHSRSMMCPSGSSSRLPTMLAACAALALSGQPALAESATDPGASARDEAETGQVRKQANADEICQVMAQAAADNALPFDFFTRLIWQESRFNPSAVSPKGAMGIAQFIPSTASARGLLNPFEPLQALRESASYLRELRTTFRGNLGLAAAAYNAGPGRVEDWLAGRITSLPGETRAYVHAITGHAVDTWASQTPPDWVASTAPTSQACREFAKLVVARPQPRPALIGGPAWGPWGVQLAGNWSEGKVLAAYERLRRQYTAVLADRLPLVLRAGAPRRASKFLVRVSEKTRNSAEALCTKLRAAGGACMVLRNPSAAPAR